MCTTVMWFRKDLRLQDNTALNQAISSLTEKEQLLCVFQLNPKQFKEKTFSHDYFFSALAQFTKHAKEKKIPIHFLYGEPLESFRQLKKQYPSFKNIFFNQDERGFGEQRDKKMVTFFKENDINTFLYQDSHLHGPNVIQKPDGSFYKKFTPYYKKWQLLPKMPYQNISLNKRVINNVDNSKLFEKGQQEFDRLCVNSVHNFGDIVGEQQAEHRLNYFLFNHLSEYDSNRDIPSVDGTSRLSHYLSTGEISIRKVWQAVSNMPDSDGKETFLKELCWRDFYHMMYHHFPRQQTVELQEKYRQLPWRQEHREVELWRNGMTGFPIIDAAMRQLNETGWMHNRLRMLVASFLTKDLLTDWRLGEHYFSEQLIDYDSASNIGGWQWAASTGTDAVPYFRIFNPASQSKSFDPEGLFIRHYVPELAHVPTKFIHEPHLMTHSEQKTAHCNIGNDYPFPIIEHKLARERALDWFKSNT